MAARYLARVIDVDAIAAGVLGGIAGDVGALIRLATLSLSPLISTRPMLAPMLAVFCSQVKR